MPESIRNVGIRRLTNRVGYRLNQHTPSGKSLALGGTLVAGSALSLLFGLDQLGVKIPTLTPGVFGGYEMGTSGVVMASVGSFFDKLSKKPDGDFDAENPNSTMVLSTVQSNAAWLVVRSGMKPGKVLDIDGDKVVVGSSMGSEIRLEHDSVGESHALIKENDGMYTVADLGTRTGTWVNDKLQSGIVLKDDSRITIGTTRLSLSLNYGNVKNGDSEETQIIGGTLFVKAGANIGESFQLGPGDTVIGSEPGESGFALEDRTVSKRHVMIRVMSRVCRLYDLGSTNGTDVDGKTIDGVALKDGDVIKFGKIEVRFVRESMM
ncbi:MAG: FHA domain-containing protein [SAR202 cluster bacterium]|jgi:pSer/pThr/pTyr-binding forkhead associated (FHA) protein|nr:FHA domain-containing protein [SAR202 cluster bacterium]MDP6713813.1 FHA domain-containing protein [SAR202 cluster bacterium]